MQVSTLSFSTPTNSTRQASSPKPAGEPPPAADSIAVRSNWTDNALVRGVTCLARNVGRNVAIIGGIPALGAAGHLIGGGPGVVAAVLGGSAAGAYLAQSSDMPGTTMERTLFGGSLAAAGTLAAALGASAGLPEAAIVVGSAAAIGVFRGCIETLSEYNLV